MKVLILSADGESTRALRAFFDGRGDEVVVKDGGGRSFAGRTFGLVMIDLGLGAKALGLCRQARARDDRGTVIVLAGGEETKRIDAALRAGADDFLLLPIESESLLARMAVIERSRAARIERGQTERSMEISRSRTRTLIDAIGDGLLLVDDQGSVALANSRFSEMTGFAGIELIGEPADDLIRDREGRRLSEALGTFTAKRRRRALDVDLKTDGEAWMPFSLTAVPIAGEEGREELALVLHRDADSANASTRDERSSLEHDQAFFRLLFQNSPDGIVMLDRDDKVVEANERFYRLFQLRPEDTVGQALTALIVPEDLAEEAAELSRTVFDQRTVDHETVRLRSDGTEVDVTIRGCPVELDDRHIGGFGIYTDISARRRAERRLFDEAFRDPLTRLPNRNLFADRLSRALNQARRGDHDFALLFVDLDGFKSINDRYGHATGDAVLVEVANRLVECLRPGDTIARFGGDEFMILLEALNRKRDAEHVADRILEVLSAPVAIEDLNLKTAASIGIAHSDEGYGDDDEILRAADRALYRAKAEGKNRIEIAPPPDAGSGRRALATALAAGLETDQIQIGYRPIAALHHGRLSGLTSFVSWRHPDQGLIAAPALRTISRQTGLSRQVLEWNLARAASDLASWQRSHPERDGLLVQVEAATQIPKTDFADRVRAILARSGVAPSAMMLILPIDSVEGRDEFSETLWSLRDIGLRLGISGVGLGAIPVRLLQTLPFDIMRLDPTLCRDLVLGSADAETVRALLALAESLSMQLIATGVDSESARSAVERTGVKWAEGRAITGETDASRLQAWLESGTAPLPAMPEDEVTETLVSPLASDRSADPKDTDPSPEEAGDADEPESDSD